MKKFLGSKLFVILTPILTLAIGGIAGWLLGYQPNISRQITESDGHKISSTTFSYVFQIKAAIGYWLLAVVISLVVFLLCVLIQKIYTEHKQTSNN